jgi:hypothetical protein
MTTDQGREGRVRRGKGVNMRCNGRLFPTTAEICWSGDLDGCGARIRVMGCPTNTRRSRPHRRWVLLHRDLRSMCS